MSATQIDALPDATSPLVRAVPAPTQTGERRGRSLRMLLVATDAAAVLAAWTVVLAGSAGGAAVHVVGAGVLLAGAATLVSVSVQRLYLARTCAVRSKEVAGLGRSAITGAVAVLLVGALIDVGRFEVEVATGALGAAAAFLALVAGRSVYRGWLGGHRRLGGFTNPVVVVGDNDEGRELCQLLADHPESGFRAAGIVGKGRRWPEAADVPHLGGLDQAIPSALSSAASGVIVATSALEPDQINRLIRDCHRCGLHVHLSNGLRGIGQRRIRSRPLAHEPLLYVEPLHLAPWQSLVKRVIDLVGVVVVGVLALPVIAVAAVLIRLDDGGPVLFRQVRVGRGGTHFTVLKLRTMVPDAEQLKAALAADNERDGPLFKQASDPRRTKIGAILERMSVDELPQLWNVLRGDMSLVGPRPALPDEVEQFDDELRQRLELLPGITGLWQVEARDNPSFEVYRRFDLFYVENWSVLLDVAILLGTVQSVAARALSSIRRRPVSTSVTGLPG